MIRAHLVGLSVLAGFLTLGACASAPTVSSSPSVDQIRADETRSGTLTASHPTLDDGSYYQDWIYQGRAGERIRVDLRSSDFDAFLLVLNASRDEELARNDDGGSGTDARVEVTLPATGPYVIVANSYVEGETGAYSLSVESIQPTTGGGTTGSRTISLGETRAGRLTSASEVLGDGSYYDRWYIDGRSGDRIRIEMRSSDFDTYLSFGTEQNGQFNQLESDDDGAGGTDSRIDVTLQRTGRYLIRANSLSAGREGEYRLSVSRR
jgi:hypothetical protein